MLAVIDAKHISRVGINRSVNTSLATAKERYSHVDVILVVTDFSSNLPTTYGKKWEKGKVCAAG